MRLGTGVGMCDGPAVGMNLVGADVAVGCVLGAGVGAADGRNDIDGTELGKELGSALGKKDGAALGLADGSAVG